MLEAASHVLSSESMGITEIARLEPSPLWAPDGRMDPAAVEEVVAENHAALLILENTHTRAGGTTLSVELTAELAAAAKRHDCRVHIDGARLLNASVALGVPPADLAAPANSVVISLNKALSAPFGAVLAGSEAVVERARLMAHRLGGGSVHRAGIAAAAGLVALDTMVDRIADDHRRPPRELGTLLAAIPGVRLQPETVETNIVLADFSGTGLSSEQLIPLLETAGLRVFERDLTRLRFVTHPLIGDAEIEQAAAIVAARRRAARRGAGRGAGGRGPRRVPGLGGRADRRDRAGGSARAGRVRAARRVTAGDYFDFLALFSSIASRTSALNAAASTSSPSGMSIARRTLPSRLELKRPVGSSSDAPLAKVSLTTFL